MTENKGKFKIFAHQHRQGAKDLVQFRDTERECYLLCKFLNECGYAVCGVETTDN